MEGERGEIKRERWRERGERHEDKNLSMGLWLPWQPTKIM